MRARHDRLLALLGRDALGRDGAWKTAAELADALGVTPRSIRSYVTAINARSQSALAIESSPAGYRLGPGAGTVLADDRADAGTPRDRQHRIVMRLLEAPGGIDIFETADDLHVSSATLESDLARVRTRLQGQELTLERTGSRVHLAGSELAQRRLMSALVHDEMDAGAFDAHALRRTLGAQADAEALGAFKRDLVARLVSAGYFVNEYGMSDVLTHVAIAVERVAQRRLIAAGAAEAGGDAREAVAGVIAELADAHLGVALPADESAHLASIVLTRVVAPGGEAETSALVDPEIDRAVRDAVREAAAQFLLDIDAEDFVLRLALHVQNVRARASDRAWSRNPLTRSLKSTYPMIFEVAVFISGALAERIGLTLHEDEIAYIAMHVGGQLERERAASDRVTATIVCPGYYELHELLRSSVDRALAHVIEVTGVDTRVDPAWDAFDADLVLTTIDPPASITLPADRVVKIQPFLTPADIERVQAAAARVRRARRLARLRSQLASYLDADAFISPLPRGLDERGVIALLGERLHAAGVTDADFVERAIAREDMSSTAFTDALAVPHAISARTAQTAISIGIADGSVPWGDARVQVVALVAFSEGDKEAFRTVFEQFVEVFNDRDSASRIARRAGAFSTFLDELVAVIDG